MFGGMMLFWALLLIVIFVALVRLVPSWSGTTRASRKTPLEQLQLRYARGEISTEEFERRRDQLTRP